jgi:ubiquinone/menaquinone biosynthesis C-methylase UbiE
MPTPIEAKTKAAQTYNAAADAYDLSANSFWDRFGRRTIDRLNPSSGARCLDVCCGSGASAIPTAKKVAPHGSVLGVDLAERLLELARAKAARQGIENIEFRVGDMLDLGLPDGHFDAVVCVFGIFFIPDMPGAVRELWRMVAPGGMLAITTWGPRFFEPANTAFWDAVATVRPELHKGFNPWDRISDPDTLRAMLEEGDVHNAQVASETGVHPLHSPEDWWVAVLGSGYRGTIEQLEPAERERVRTANLAAIRTGGVAAVEANVLYATAIKP